MRPYLPGDSVLIYRDGSRGIARTYAATRAVAMDIKLTCYDSISWPICAVS